MDVMQPFYAHTFLTIVRMMETVLKMPLGLTLDDTQRVQAQAAFSDAAEMCKAYGLTASRVSAKKVLVLLSKTERPYDKFRELVGELQERIIDEISEPRFFSLTDQEAAYYNEWSKGWREIIDRFPGATIDVEEMRKCFAVSRYAAAVFHSVCVVEHGLIGLGNFIGVSDPKSGWTAVCGKLETLVIKTRFPDLPPAIQPHYGFLEQVHGTVMALKNAWRNKISHAQGRLVVLTPDFTPEIADEIIVATRAFMRRLATEMPPD